MRIIFDIETDGLLHEATKIHCFCFYDLDKEMYKSIVDYDEMKNLLLTEDLTLIGHNIIRYDIPVLNKILGLNVKGEFIDTLSLSWTLYPNNTKHGLEAWGEIFNIKKPEIKDWNNLSIEDYIHRCTEDVKINTALWKRQNKLLNVLYKDENQLKKYIQYISFKTDCVREQEEIGVKLDVEHCKTVLTSLSQEKEQKINQLKAAMPKNPIKKKKTYSNAIKDKNGNIFQKGDLFFSTLDVEGDVQEIKEEITIGYEEPNPNSVSQIKNWLYSLGWVPEHIKHVRDKETGEISKIPQIASKNVQGEVCDSVKKLFDKEPNLELLNGLSVLSHRISIFEGFLKYERDGRLYPTFMGLTNTLRLQHSIIVNLPSVDKKYGEDVRKCLIADEGKLLAGCDLSGIEDATKRHYIYKYDPAYVEEMNTPGFDPHLDIAMLAGLLTKEQVKAHKEGKENHKTVRQRAKTLNFSATYKVGAETLARNASMSLKEAKSLLEIYWKRNNAILEVEKALKVKEIFGQKWLLNPVSGFWYSLRADKDKFSTLNQGTAVYVFDTWIKYLRAQGVKISYQCHDEWLANINSREEITPIVKKAIDLVNEELKLNVTIGCSIDVGINYANVH